MRIVHKHVTVSQFNGEHLENVLRCHVSANQPRNLKDLGEQLFKATSVLNSEKRETSKNIYCTFRQRLTTVLVRKGALYN